MVLEDQSVNCTDLLSLDFLKLTTPSIYLTKESILSLLINGSSKWDLIV